MAQYDLNLRDAMRIVRRRWRVIAFSTLLVVGFSYLFGKSRQPVYSSFSSVKIEETNTIAGMLMQRMTYSRWDNIATAQELIRSFPVMERAAKRLGKIDRDLTSEEIQTNPELSRMINNMIAKVSTERSGRTNIIDIRVTSTDPSEARDIAQALAQVFTEVHLEERSSQERETRRFIENQLRLARSALAGAEEKLQQFRSATNLPILDEQILLNLEQLQRLSERKQRISKRINELQSQIGQARSRMTYAPSDTIPDDPERSIDWFQIDEFGTGPWASMNERLLALEREKREVMRQFKPQYSRVQELEQEIKEILGQILREAEDLLENYREERSVLEEEITQIQDKLDEVPVGQRRYAELLREVELREEQYQMLSLKYQEALIQEADQAEEVSVVRPAMLNSSPINVNLNRMIAVGLVIGLALGFVLAFLFETFDTSIGTIEDVEEFLQVPVLGVIPHIDIDAVAEHMLSRNPGLENNPNLEAHARLVTHFAPKDPVAEGYRALRTALQFRSIDNPVKTITCTSASLQEGKSTTLVNLALTMAQGGTKVLLVACNLRRPSVYRVFGLDQAPGVVDIVLGRKEWRDTVRTVTDIIMGDMGMDSALMTPGMENLHIITSGGIPPNPAEMLVSENMREFIDEASKEFDVVLFDSPPILPVTDSAILAKRTDATLLVYRTGKVPRAALRRAKVQIEGVGANVIGVVLNDLKSEMVGYTGSHYYYGKYYGAAGNEEVVEGRRGAGRRGGLLGKLLGKRKKKDAETRQA